MYNEKVPTAVLSSPFVLFSSVFEPTATLLSPVVFKQAAVPKAVLQFPDIFSKSVFVPTLVLLIPSIIAIPEDAPTAVFHFPVLSFKAFCPKAELTPLGVVLFAKAPIPYFVFPVDIIILCNIIFLKFCK